jgi:hypothetical protein
MVPKRCRRVIVTLASWCFLGSSLLAQDLGANTDYGVKVGPVFVLDHNNRQVEREGLGLSGGLFYDSSFDSRAALQVDALLVWRKLTASETYRSLLALEFPVLFRVNSIRGQRRGLNFFGVTGPAFAFTLHQPIAERSATPPYSAFNVTWAFGGGVEIDRLVVEGRYALGLAELQGDHRVNELIDLRSFTLTFGMRLQ